jgi:hypothetical protein
MAKLMSNSKRAKERRSKQAKIKFQEAIADGHTSRRDVSKSMGITHFELSNFFEENPKAYKVYTQRRRELVDIAADNVQDIVEDKTHPKHYEASKYVLQNYKSDLDNILDKTDGEEINIAGSGDEESSGIVIKFVKNKDGES